MNTEILTIEEDHRTSIPTIVAAVEALAIIVETIAMATEPATRTSPAVWSAGRVASLVIETTTAQTRNRLIRKRFVVPLTTRIVSLTLNRKRKSEAAGHLLNFIAFVETSTGNKVKIVRSDEGTELDSNYLKARLQELGIVHQTSCRYTPQQNGVAERMNRTGMEAVRSIIYTRSNKITNMFEQDPRSVLELWGDFLIAVVYVLNRVISSTKTPYELFFGTKPDLSNLRVIGCRAYPHTPDPIRKSLDPKSKPCWFVGYGDGQKGWIVWNPTTREYTTSPSVRFDETLLITDVPESKGSQMNVSQKNFVPFHIVSTILGLVTS